MGAGGNRSAPRGHTARAGSLALGVGYDADVVVVGAGPVGCGVALGLARRGIDALVVDRDPEGRDKVCGEGLLPHGVAAAARLGLPVEGPAFVGIRYVAGDRVADGDLPAPGRGLDRRAFDAACAAAVARAGPVRRGVRVTGLSGGGGDLTIRTTAGPLRARLVIAADGARSPLRRALGLDAPARGRRRWAVRRHHALRGPPLDRVEVHLLVGGEGYLTPIAGGVNVALLLEDEAIGAFRGDLDGATDRLLARSPGLAERLGPALRPAGATGPLRQTARGLAADGALLVGDAAGFVDGITGEGMSLGLEGAEIAAEIAAAACASGRLSAEDLRAWTHRHRALVARSRALTELLVAGVRHRWLARAAVGVLAARPALFDHLLAIDVGAARLRDLPAAWLRRSRGGRSGEGGDTGRLDGWP